jgi:hypothetical protein
MLFAKISHLCLPRDRVKTMTFMDRTGKKEGSDVILS